MAALADPSDAQGIDTYVQTCVQGLTSGSFFTHFNMYMYQLVNTPESLAFATRAVLAEFASDGVAYLELRTTPRALPGGSAEASVRTILGEIGAWNNSSNGDIMPVRLILSVDRAKHDSIACGGIVDLALKLRGEGHPIVGLDLCGDPNKLIDVSTLRGPFLRARALGLPCVLHFAEVVASSTARELDELLSWQPRRLGHAIHVPEATRDRILAAGAAPELCLSCNVLAGMLPPKTTVDGDGNGCHCPAEMIDHHFGWWWEQGGPLSLGTDDVGVFGSTSSEEHQHAAVHFNLSRRDLVALSRRAMAGALGTPQDELRIDRLLDTFAVSEGIEVEEVAAALAGTDF